MKLKKITSAMLALAGAAMLIQSATAATTAYNDGDLLIGFRSTNSSVTQDYIVNVGSVSLYTNLASGSTVNIGNIGADLTSAFGSSWYGSSSLLWSVAGTVYYGDSTYGSDQVFLSSTSKTAGFTDGFDLSLVAGSVFSLGSLHYAGNTSGANSEGLIQPTSGNSYVSYLQGGSNSSGGSFSSGYITEGTTSQFLYVYSMTEGDTNAASLIGDNAGNAGSFKIDNSGNLTYSAVPEPSTYALMILGAFVLIWCRASRRQGLSV